VTTMLRVLIADDHPLYLNGLQLLIEQTPGLQLAATATTGDTVVALAASHRPDVVVMDIQMPGLSGIEATKQIVAARPETAVLILTMFDHDDYVFAALRAGARGYVLKGAGTEEIALAIRGVAAGQATFGPSIAGRILDYFTGPEQHRQVPHFPHLTQRELDVLTLLAQDLGNNAIARRLGIESKTVRNYVSAIIVKLHVADRAAAAERARQAGLGGQ
jgi:DNA-binding NarL/FixJ family response regulator